MTDIVEKKERELYHVRITEDDEMTIMAHVATDGGEEEHFQIPPQMASQMGMALQMMREQLG